MTHETTRPEAATSHGRVVQLPKENSTVRVITRLVGTSPLLQHNIQLANPDNEWTRRISEITAKRKKTEEDRQAISRLEFQGSLYVDGGKVVIPTTNVRKCFQETAKITKQGKSIVRAVNAVQLNVPLVYDGPQDVDGIVSDQTFYDTTMVGVGTKRVLRTRPIFRAWALVAEWELITEAMDYDAFAKIVNLAGTIEGLGDNRTGGYGRFTAEVKAA
jgi:hypothetical protein